MSFAVMTDTSANLPTTMLQEKEIGVIAFPYMIGGETFHCTDTESFPADEFYTSIKKGAVVTTSQIAPKDYMDFFEPCLKQGKDILFVAMSSGISGSCGSAHIAAGELSEDYPERKIEIVDALGASLGEGLLALQAAELRDQDLSVEDAAARLREAVERMFNVFTVDDLMHLKRGGRLSNLSAVIGTVLQIKPILKGNEEGKIVAFAKVRGRKQSILTLAEMYDKLVKDPEKQTVGIAQALCREDAEMLASLLQKNRPPRQILTVEYEPVTGSHVGPGALALFFESEAGVRTYDGRSVISAVREAVSKVGERLPHPKLPHSRAGK